MKIKDGFILKKIGGTAIVVAVGKRVKEFGGIGSLNDTAEFLWNNLGNAENEEDLADMLCSEYDVTKDKALDSCKIFLEKLKKAKILDD